MQGVLPDEERIARAISSIVSLRCDPASFHIYVGPEPALVVDIARIEGSHCVEAHLRMRADAVHLRAISCHAGYCSIEADGISWRASLFHRVM
tara:strand:+ start:353 stop:631 length:279 start_codon:yes stop_codon:yes gene_type:complete